MSFAEKLKEKITENKLKEQMPEEESEPFEDMAPTSNGKHPLMGLNHEERTSMEAMMEEVKEEPALKDKLFTRDDNLEMKTRLTPELSVQIANGKAFALIHNLPELEMYLEDLMATRVSLLGEGRKEGVEMEKGTSLYGFAQDVAQRTKG